jgi:signal transduction histidine kinase/HAMP domain-containing protein
VRYGIGIRWWLAAAFAAIAAVTALAVGKVLSDRSEDAFRDRAQALAAGNAFEAAIAIRRRLGPADVRSSAAVEELQREVERVAQQRRLALFVFDAEGNLLTASRSRGVELDSIDGRGEALRSALAGNRFVSTNEAVRATLVAFPRRDSTALIAYASHPDLGAGVEILQTEIVRAAGWAILIGALAGMIVAALIATRLRRIASAAAAIEQGRFETALRPWFRDEVGELAATLDQMRIKLQESFERLRADRDRFERLLERLQDGVVTVDASLRVDFANRAARRLLGTPHLRSGEPLPEPWVEPSLRELASSLFAPRAEAAENEVALADDTTLVVAGLPAPRRTETAVIVITDVSERERRERAEREFVANAAHELRTPLTTITGAVEALRSGADDVEAERDRFLTHIEREADRLRRLVRALLVLARAQTGEEALRLRPVELAPLLEDIRDDMSPREGVRVEISCPPALTAVADRELISQALANIAANSARHTSTGRIQLRASSSNGSVTIEVSDTGPGIPAGDRERLFDRFYRGQSRDSEGFGLGLAIVREAVRAIGGSVTVESSPGEGTTVRIQLPAADARVP